MAETVTISSSLSIFYFIDVTILQKNLLWRSNPVSKKTLFLCCFVTDLEVCPVTKRTGHLPELTSSLKLSIYREKVIFLKIISQCWLAHIPELTGIVPIYMGGNFGYWMQTVCGFDGRENFPVAQCRAAVANAPAGAWSLFYRHSRDSQHTVAWKAGEGLQNTLWGQWPWGRPWRKKNKRNSVSTLTSLRLVERAGERRVG